MKLLLDLDQCLLLLGSVAEHGGDYFSLGSVVLNIKVVCGWVQSRTKSDPFVRYWLPGETKEK